MLLLLTVICIVFLAYFALITSFILGVLRVNKLNIIKENKTNLSRYNLKISIVIPFRNEENNLENLFKNLTNQEYLKENFQLILIDDNSTDNSFQLANRCKGNYPQNQIKILKNNSDGKKAALKLGVYKSDYNLIVTTDADCYHNKFWLIEIARFYTENDFDFIIAPVKIISDNSFFGKFQEIEFLSLQASSIGSYGIQKPIMCNSANLIFDKNLFLESDNKSTIASGDDMFFLHSVKSNPKNKIGYLLSEKVIVSTKAISSLRQFINQRLRWASKAKYYNDTFSITTALLIFATISTVFLLLILSMKSIIYFIAFITVLLVKSILDFVLMNYTNKVFKIRGIILFIIPFELLYVIYSFTVALLSFFSISYNWKGRKHRY